MLPFDVPLKEIVWFLLGIVATVLVGYFFYRIGLPKKRLTYSVERRRIVWTTGNYPMALRITFNDQPVTDLSRLVVYIWNTGTQAITRADLETKDRLRLTFKGFSKADTLQMSVGTQSRQANNATLEDNLVNFDYLNPEDGITIELFIESAHLGEFLNVANADANSPVLLEGEIIGVRSKPDYVQFSDVNKPREMFLVMLGSAVMSMLGIAIAVNSVIIGHLDLRTVTATAIGTGLLIVGGPVFSYALYILLRKPKIPKPLQTS